MKYERTLRKGQSVLIQNGTLEVKVLCFKSHRWCLLELIRNTNCINRITMTPKCTKDLRMPEDIVYKRIPGLAGRVASTEKPRHIVTLVEVTADTACLSFELPEAVDVSEVL